MRRYFVLHTTIFALSLSLSSSLPAQSSTDVTAFKKAHQAALEVKALDVASPKFDAVLELLIQRVWNTTQKSGSYNARDMGTSLATYQKVVGNSEGLADELTWLGASIARRGDSVAILVNYGPLAKLAVFDRKVRVKLPPNVAFIRPFAGHVSITPDGTVVVNLNSVQAMGMRDRLRVITLSNAGGWKVGADLNRAKTLEWGGVELKGDRLTVTSIDEPKSFFTTAPETLFERAETFLVSQGKLTSLQAKLDNPELRWLDDWMATAQKAKNPDAMQKKLKSYYREPALLEGWSCTKPKAGVQIYTIETSVSLKITVLSKGGKHTISKIEKL